MKTLKLFNAVVAKETKETKPFVSEEGYIIEQNALWAKDNIIKYYQKEKLNGNDLNKTFHKSWEKIKDSSRFELFIEQIMHYVSTYGRDFKDEIYIPNEVLELPDVKLKYIVVKAYTHSQMTEKCLLLLKSGIALEQKTVDDLISILVDSLNYTFTGKEGIKNKEAIVKIAETYQVYPEKTSEFLRYIIYKTTNTTLLIKNHQLINLIKESSYNPTQAFNNFGLEKLSESFNRFKPLFLAFKNKCPKTINKISKLSKKYHKPLTSNPINEVTQNVISDKDIMWLDNATVFSLFKALSACYLRTNGQNNFVYRIRNGKSWISEKNAKHNVVYENYIFILNYLKNRIKLNDVKIYFPNDIEYALPTSEKMFVGNIPTGTKFFGKKLAVGIYWENSWGARDLDLSGLNIVGKIGWNASYNQNRGSLMYSGDVTSAPNGAVEYLYANNGLNFPTLVQNSVYNGENDCEFKIIIGRGDDITKNYMMNPDNLLAEIKTKSVQEQTILGMLLPDGERQSFVLLNFAVGHAKVSGHSKMSDIATKALYEQWNNPLNFKEIIKELGAQIVDKKENANIDLSLNNLEKDTFIKMFMK